MAVQGVDRTADTARSERGRRSEAPRRAEAQPAREERRAPRETNRGQNVDVRG